MVNTSAKSGQITSATRSFRWWSMDRWTGEDLGLLKNGNLAWTYNLESSLTSIESSNTVRLVWFPI